MRQMWVVLLVGAGIVSGGAWLAWRQVAIGKPKLNLVLITLDTTRADHLRCYGYQKALTPTVDALAKRGTLFERAYSPAPFTLPAHASIHTGIYPFKHGLFNNGMSSLNASIPTLADTLAHAGYVPGAFVGSFVLDKQFGLNRGFLNYDDAMAPKGKDSHGFPQRSADKVVDAALPWLTEHAEHPFFCWLHFYDPHFEYLDHNDVFGDRFQENPYDGEIAFVDRELQRVIAFLESRKLTERTVIIVVGDHGEGLGDHLELRHGDMLYNSTLRVPLIVSLPSQASSDSRVATTVSTIDVGATALDCLGVSPSVGFGGRSLKPALMGQTISPDECYGASDGVFVQEGWSPLRCLVTEDWKYIQTTKPELYDMKNDPGETTNLVDAKPELAKELDERLRNLESEGVRHETQVLELSSREQNVLASLGYLGGRKSQPVLESDENLPDIKDSMALMYEFQIVQELYWRRQKDEVVSRLQRLVADAPHYMAPKLMAGRVLETEGKLDEAKRYYAEILQVDPDNKEANARFGKILAREGEYHRSVPYLHKALDRDAKGVRSVTAADALPDLLKALKTEPNSVEMHYVVAMMLRVQGRQNEAVVHMRQAEMAGKQQNDNGRKGQ